MSSATTGRPRRRGRSRRPARRRGAAPRRAAGAGAGGVRPGRRAGGHRRRRRLPLRPRLPGAQHVLPGAEGGARAARPGLARRPPVRARCGDPRPATASCTASSTRCAAPRRRPRPPSTTCSSPLGQGPAGWPGRAGCWGRRPRGPPTRIKRSGADDLAAAGLGGPVTDRFLRPFLSGVLGETALETSEAFVRLVWRSFALGTIVVPDDGMEALPRRLAAALPVRHRLADVRVRSVHGRGAPVGDAPTTASCSARAVLVAADPRTAASLLPGVAEPRMNAADHVLPRPAAGADVRAAAAPGRHRRAGGQHDGDDGRRPRLLGGRAAAGGVVDRRDVASTAGSPRCAASSPGSGASPPTTGTHLHTAEVPEALPLFPAGRPVRRDVELGDGLFVAGDHRDTPSTQGALVSGRRAAQAVLGALGR